MAEIVEAPFRAPWWLRSPHLQTLWGPLWRRADDLTRRRETLPLADGDHLLLDWAGPAPAPASCAWCCCMACPATAIPTMCAAPRRGWRRRASPRWRSIPGARRRPTTRRCPTMPARSTTWTRCSAICAPPIPRAAGGHGRLLGGSRLLNWLARADSGALSAAVAVCSPLGLATCADRMDRGLSRIYRRHLIGELLANLRRQRRHLETVAPDQARRLAALDLDGIRSFWQFDGRVIAPLYGFRDAAHYYAECSAGPRLPAIRTPR